MLVVACLIQRRDTQLQSLDDRNIFPPLVRVWIKKWFESRLKSRTAHDLAIIKYQYVDTRVPEFVQRAYIVEVIIYWRWTDPFDTAFNDTVEKESLGPAFLINPGSDWWRIAQNLEVTSG